MGSDVLELGWLSELEKSVSDAADDVVLYPSEPAMAETESAAGADGVTSRSDADEEELAFMI